MKYSELKAENDKLKRDLQLANMIIENAHEELDKLGAPNAKLGAHPGHRVLWFGQKLEKEKDKDRLNNIVKLEDTTAGFPDTSREAKREEINAVIKKNEDEDAYETSEHLTSQIDLEDTTRTPEEDLAWSERMAKLEDAAGSFPDRSGQLARLPESYIHKLPIIKDDL